MKIKAILSKKNNNKFVNYCSGKWCARLEIFVVKTPNLNKTSKVRACAIDMLPFSNQDAGSVWFEGKGRKRKKKKIKNVCFIVWF